MLGRCIEDLILYIVCVMWPVRYSVLNSNVVVLSLSSQAYVCAYVHARLYMLSDGVLYADMFLSTFFQPELYLCTPVKVDFTKSYYISE